MKCPKCNHEIARHLMAAALGSIGGTKSRRILTSKQAKAMNKAKRIKNQLKKGNKPC